MTTTRRERLRAELIADVKVAALAQLRAKGPDGLSLRAVARDVGMSPAGLYRYFEGRDELLTVLITDGYDDLADHLATALDVGDDELSELDRARRGAARRPPQVPEVAGPDASPAARMRAVCRAYRDWSVRHPNEFALLFGTPIAGYAAPAGGPTVEANRRVGGFLLRPMVEGVAAGDLDLARHPAPADVGEGGEALRADLAGILGQDVSAAFAVLTISLWGWLHGIVSLEVFGQLDWIYPDGAGLMFEAALAQRLQEVGWGEG